MIDPDPVRGAGKKPREKKGTGFGLKAGITPASEEDAMNGVEAAEVKEISLKKEKTYEVKIGFEGKSGGLLDIEVSCSFLEG